MKPLSMGKLRGLQQCTTTHGALVVFALDHRGNLRRTLNPNAPDTVTSMEMSAFKSQVVGALAPAVSAVLLDPEVGAAQCIVGGALPGNIGLVVAIEATGYTGQSTARQSRILPGWSVAKAKRMGANAVKLLVYYHPDSPAAMEIEELVQQTAHDCTKHDIAFMLEPLSYALDSKKQLSPARKRRVVIETARRLVMDGVDVLKAEFPTDVTAEPDEHIWAEACAELSEVCNIPWVVLSAGVNYETYLRQVTVACQSGASGVAVGRAIWKEVVTLTGQARTNFLQSKAQQRMERITALCNALARPWAEHYLMPDIGPDWYNAY